jgi:hypothetical protein
MFNFKPCEICNLYFVKFVCETPNQNINVCQNCLLIGPLNIISVRPFVHIKEKIPRHYYKSFIDRSLDYYFMRMIYDPFKVQ